MNPQEQLWAGTFGDAYHVRNPPKNRLEFWMHAVGRVCSDVKSVLEIGAGQGDNLDALRTLIPCGKFTGIDINTQACQVMRDRGFFVIDSPAELAVPTEHDLVITRGFLIHLADVALADALRLIYNSSKRYICIAEYFSPERREIKYRGYEAALWSDDFCRELMKRYPDLKILDYGFVYHTDGGDDLTWFLLEK